MLAMAGVGEWAARASLIPHQNSTDPEKARTNWPDVANWSLLFREKNTLD